jgi:hypothetical protein
MWQLSQLGEQISSTKYSRGRENQNQSRWLSRKQWLLPDQFGHIKFKCTLGALCF